MNSLNRIFISMFLFCPIFSLGQVLPLPNCYDSITEADDYYVQYNGNGKQQSVVLYNKNNSIARPDKDIREDINNKYIDHGSLCVTGGFSDYNLHVMNEILLDVFGWERSMKLFDKRNQDLLSKSGINVYYVFHPLTGEIIELSFTMLNNSFSDGKDTTIFTISPYEFNQLETQIKKRIRLEVNPENEANRNSPYGILSCGLGFYWDTNSDNEDYPNILL